MSAEIFKPVVGYEDIYKVSEFGKVLNIKTGRILKANKNKGYLRLGLSRKDKNSNFKIHSLVSKAFLGPRPAGLVVNHKDGNKENNHPSNLEYVTHRQNKIHAVSNGLAAMGEGHGMAKLSREKVIQIHFIRNLTRKSHKEIADIFNVSKALIGFVLNRKIWKHVSVLV